MPGVIVSRVSILACMAGVSHAASNRGWKIIPTCGRAGRPSR